MSVIHMPIPDSPLSDVYKEVHEGLLLLCNDEDDQTRLTQLHNLLERFEDAFPQFKPEVV